MDPLRMMELGVDGTFKRRLKSDAALNVPLASPDSEKKMAKLQLFNTYTFAGERKRGEHDDLHVLLNYDLHSNIINYYRYSRLAFAHM
jgi:hypothetical protein